MSRSELEDRLAEQLRLAALDERAPWPFPPPVREHHFDWCCEHRVSEHRRAETVGIVMCHGCSGGGVRDYHDYRHGRDFRFDFAWPEQQVAVECDGGTYTNGRHNRGAGIERDSEKFSEAAAQGWRVIRLTRRMITSGEALGLIARALKGEGEAGG